jgi:hypothetical protein
MARAQAQYLRIYSGATTYQRWQSYYVDSVVNWENNRWTYIQFAADGITAGGVESEESITVSMPAMPIVIDAAEAALNGSQLVEFRMYEFDTLLGNSTPQAGQTLIATYIGEVVGLSATLARIDMQLGSALSPVGAQVPPRKFTTRLIGVPCRL